MSNRKLGILAIVAVVMVLWAVVQSRMTGRGRTEPSDPTYLIQGLDWADIGRIVVGEGDDAITMERKDAQFVVLSEAGYPADVKQINDLITKMLDVKTLEVYTSNPKNHEELEVTETKARHVVKFFKSDGSLLTGLVVGKSQEAGQGAYVRRASDDTVYLAESVPWFRNGALDYVDQEIVSLKREDVNTVTVSTPEGTYALRPSDSADGVVLADLPPDRKLKDSDAKSVFEALTTLRFDDVNAPEEIDGLVFDHEYVCRLKDSTEYRLHLAKKDDKTYLKCEAEYTDPTRVTINTGQVDSEEELKKKEAKLLAQEKAQKFALRHKSWVYLVPDWKAKNLTMNRSALLEDVPQEAAEPTQDGPPEQPAAQPPTVEPEATVEPEPAVEPNAPATQP